MSLHQLIQLTLPIPPSVNNYLKRYGKHIVKSQEAQDFDALVTAACYEAGVYQPTTRPIEFKLVFYPANNRRDLDNLFKVTFDAFEGMVYKNDKQITRIEAIKKSVDKENPRIEVTISEFR